MSWMWVISLIVAVGVGANLGVIVMALVQNGAREDRSAEPALGESP